MFGILPVRITPSSKRYKSSLRSVRIHPPEMLGRREFREFLGIALGFVAEPVGGEPTTQVLVAIHTSQSEVDGSATFSCHSWLSANGTTSSALECRITVRHRIGVLYGFYQKGRCSTSLRTPMQTTPTRTLDTQKPSIRLRTQNSSPPIPLPIETIQNGQKGLRTGG